MNKQDYFDFWDTNYSHALFLANKHANKKVKYFTFSSLEWFVFDNPLFRTTDDGSLMPRDKSLELEWLAFRGLKPIHNTKEFAFDIGRYGANACRVVDTSVLVSRIVTFAVKNPYIHL